MARSIYFMAFLVLAMTLFAAYGVQGDICTTPPRRYIGVCWSDTSCRKVCVEMENFEDGYCSKIQRKCLCTWTCVLDNIPNDAGTIMLQDAKTMQLLEEKFLNE
ncbi:hypothetical protein FXO38_08823 [Capsicum annuum]|uniref:Knottins-like domain-containing protein n=1 Tax=Capsicum annuum TaxID=4072 RepID=A0A1U8EZX8_CAPAN|nr:flower-specific defensin-like [Capsicum annuum]KAF3666976.1 hypothetical protein FXO38_08823 [Capsicum annuum]PHT75082.1 hypothetical protein T459_18604 [Capsicum annuum]